MRTLVAVGLIIVALAAAIQGLWSRGSTDRLAVVSGIKSDGFAQVSLPGSFRAPVNSLSSGDLITGSVDAAAIGTGQVSPVELTLELQRELMRVGCYRGESHGNWDAQSRLAMRSFLKKIGVSQAVGRPNAIQLTLVRAYSGTACDSTLPVAGPAVSAVPEGVNRGQAAGARPIAAERRTNSAVSIIRDGRDPNGASAADGGVPGDGLMAVGAAARDGALGLAAPVGIARGARREGGNARPGPHRKVRRRRSRAWTGTFFDRN